MIESLVVILLMTVVFLGAFQFFHAAAARDVLDHAAARAARARTVGFNEWMVIKAARVAAIPVSGKMLAPDDVPPDPGIARLFNARTPGRAWDQALRANPGSPRAQLETALIPEYMASPHSNQSRQLLDYEAWEGNGTHALNIAWDEDFNPLSDRVGKITCTVGRAFDMLISWADVARAFPSRTDPGVLNLEGRYEIESHFNYYLDDRGW